MLHHTASILAVALIVGCGGKSVISPQVGPFPDAGMDVLADTARDTSIDRGTVSCGSLDGVWSYNYPTGVERFILLAFCGRGVVEVRVQGLSHLPEVPNDLYQGFQAPFASSGACEYTVTTEVGADPGLFNFEFFHNAEPEELELVAPQSLDMLVADMGPMRFTRTDSSSLRQEDFSMCGN